MNRPAYIPQHILWITENYFPSQGGMAQSCDRIVNGLRKRGLTVDILHLTRSREFKDSVQQGGNYYCRSLGDDVSHGLNLVWKDLKSLNRDWTQISAFGGYVSFLAAPVYSAWLELPLTIHIRGNDFDAGVFSPRRREILDEAIRKSSAVAVVSSDKIPKIEALFPKANIIWTPNGIDLNNWNAFPSDEQKCREFRRIANSKMIVGLFGHIKPKKGGLFFLEAVKKGGLHENIHMLRAGCPLK